MVNSIRNVCLKLMTLLSVAVLLSCFMVSEGRADSLYEWNRSCRRKTICTTKIYSIGDENRLIATIPANTYVKVHGQYKWAEISYMTSSGQSGRGLADPACIGYAVVWFTDANGDRRGMQELEYYEKYGNNAAPGATMDEVWPGYSDYTQTGKNNQEETNTTSSLGSQMESDKKESTTSTSTTKKSSSTKTTTTKTTTTKTATSDVNTDVLWQDELISVKTWGLHSSVILVDGKEQIVPTHELTFSEKVDAAKRVAYIHAPRTGRCYLRAKASDKGNILDKCPAGTVVQVIKYGKNYCQIVFEGQVGYVQTACLKFANPKVEPMCTWQLSYNGKMTGNAQVPIRNDKSNDSASVVKLRSGTEVTVFSKSGSWYEVEYEGLHGFVHKNFLRMDE